MLKKPAFFAAIMSILLFQPSCIIHRFWGLSDEQDKKKETSIKQPDDESLKPASSDSDTVIVDDATTDLQKLSAQTKVDSSKTISDSLPSEPELFESVSYASVDWISLEGLRNDRNSNDEINNKIYDEINNLIEDIQERRRPEFNETQIDNINIKWQREKEEKNNDWVENFFSQEEDVNRKYQDYIEKLREEEEIKGIIAQLEREKNNLINRINNYNENIEQIGKWKEKENENYRWRLSSIPYNILLIGRAPYQDEDPDSLRQNISDAMNYKAIEKINGSRILKLDVIEDNENLKSYVAEYTEGHALVSDSYQCMKVRVITPIYFQISRIEVYPFNVTTIDTKVDFDEPEQEYNGNIDIFEYDHNSKLLISLDDFQNDQSLEQVRFYESEVNFLRSQQRNIRKANRKTEEKIKNVREIYLNNIDKYDSNISSFNSDINSINKRKKDIEGRIIEDELELEDIGEDMENYLQLFKASEKIYEEHYNNRESLVNKNVESVLNVGENIPAKLKDMILSSRKILEDLKRQSQRSVVIYGSEVNQMISLNKKEVEFIPDLIAFKILYLGAKDFAESINYFLNISYKVKWTLYSQEVEDSTSTSTDIIWNSNSPPLEICKDYIRVDLDDAMTTNALIDSMHQKVWYQLSVEVKSPLYSDIEESPPGFRKPTYDELNQLDNARNLTIERSGDDIFHIMGWQDDYPFFADETMINPDNNETLYKCRDFSERSEIGVFPQGMVYILWVMDLSDSEQ